VTRRVEKVEFVLAVWEVESGRADRDPALLLHLHPVRCRGATVDASLDGATRLDGPRVEKELFGERGLARVGVADDRERPATLGFFEDLFRHKDQRYPSISTGVARWGRA
jgi:hypothetical protein